MKSERCGTDGTGNVFVLSSVAWRPHRWGGAPSHRWCRQVVNSLGNLQKKGSKSISNTFKTVLTSPNFHTSIPSCSRITMRWKRLVVSCWCPALFAWAGRESQCVVKIRMLFSTNTGIRRALDGRNSSVCDYSAIL